VIFYIDMISLATFLKF